MKALLSLYDKTGAAELAGALHGLGMELVSTGSTHRTLTEAGLPVQQVADLTGFPEMLDGRVKTLHPVVHAGILARRDVPDHAAQLALRGLQTIDLVAVNLYPFEATITKAGVTLQDALENIDIGGPTLLRAAAKNHPFVVVLSDPADYGWVAERLEGGGLSAEERRALAAKAFQHVALYDTLIARWLRGDEGFSEELTLGLRKVQALRYGENPHQRAALYATAPSSGGVVSANRLHGVELSYVNTLDADAAWRAAQDFPQPTVALIKHATPCGLASHPRHRGGLSTGPRRRPRLRLRRHRRLQPHRHGGGCPGHARRALRRHHRPRLRAQSPRRPAKAPKHPHPGGPGGGRLPRASPGPQRLRWGPAPDSRRP